jgi:hypothetical protein
VTVDAAKLGVLEEAGVEVRGLFGFGVKPQARNERLVTHRFSLFACVVSW